jgi:hypothetical protein
MVVRETKAIEAGAIHDRLQVSAHRQDGVADGFRIEPAPIHAPQVTIAAVDLRSFNVRDRRLAINAAGDNQPMQVLQRLVAVAKVGGQPIEQLGMRGPRTHAAEVVGTVNESGAEMVVPNAVDD